MKKVMTVLTMAIVAFAINLNSAMAADMCSPVAAVADGNDVLLPEIFMKTVAGTGPVYAANDQNGWLVRNDKDGTDWQSVDRLAMSEIKKDGNCWRAKGLKGVRFNAARMNGSTIAWGKPEAVWAKDSLFVVIGDDGWSILVK